MRGAGSTGVVAAARTHLGDMPLRPFGTPSRSTFLSRLDTATNGLRRVLPKRAQYWGLARKGLNIFLRDCLYNAYLRSEFGLAAAEEFFEVPLDSITGTHLVLASRGALPRWHTVRGLDARTSTDYQKVAATLAAECGIARIHLDAVWWGERD
jgi:hypothetical protein